MKELTSEELMALTFGQKVYRFQGYDVTGFRYVGRMPSSKNYLIFSDGENLTNLYISPKTQEFSGKWYGGEYSSEFVGNLLIGKFEKRIQTVKKVYFKETENKFLHSDFDMNTWDGIFEFQAKKDGANYTLLKEWIKEYCEAPKLKNIEKLMEKFGG